MAIEFLCKTCREPIQAPDSAAGKQGKCSHCDTVMGIPVRDFQGNEDQIRTGELQFLISTAVRDSAESDATLRFQCGLCSKRLQVPAAQSHKKVVCSECRAVMRLSVDCINSEPISNAGDNPLPADDLIPEKIEFECNNCNSIVAVPQEFAGKQGKCPYCDQVMVIPEYSSVRRFRDDPLSSLAAGTMPNAAGPGSYDPLGLPTSNTIPTTAGGSSSSHRSTPKQFDESMVLPWEQEEYDGKRFWDSSKVLLFSPSRAFGSMKFDESTTKAIGYSTKGHLIGWLLTVLTAIPWIAFLLMAAEQASDEQFDYPKIYTWIGIGAGAWIVGSQLLSLAFVFIFTTTFHGGLLITGSSPREIDVTFRITAYISGVMGLTTVLSLPIAMISSIIWIPALAYHGAVAVHKTPPPQAFLAVIAAIILPILIIGGFYLVMFS